jgi:Phosphopantetheine attachment site.
MDMKDTLRHFIAEKTFSNPQSILNETALFEEGIFDSMGLLSLINFIESEYQVVTSDVELIDDNFRSIDTIADFIQRKQTVMA